MAATLSGSYPEFGEGPEDVEYECLCGAKMYKRKHVRGYAERPFRPMEPGRFEKWPYNI